MRTWRHNETQLTYYESTYYELVSHCRSSEGFRIDQQHRIQYYVLATSIVLISSHTGVLANSMHSMDKLHYGYYELVASRITSR